ncbi:hypothetical protein J6590_022569 [Homalodisca vitripennis]|nr:hypothetical protein J6590_022569 [Homalodisca vitripennis]
MKIVCSGHVMTRGRPPGPRHGIGKHLTIDCNSPHKSKCACINRLDLPSLPALPRAYVTGLTRASLDFTLFSEWNSAVILRYLAGPDRTTDKSYHLVTADCNTLDSLGGGWRDATLLFSRKQRSDTNSRYNLKCSDGYDF